MTAEQRIKELEEELELYKTDGIIGFYFSLNRKLNELTNALNEYEINLSEESKEFERFWKSGTENMDFINCMTSLEKIIKERYGVSEVKEEKKNVPFIEQYITEKKKK